MERISGVRPRGAHLPSGDGFLALLVVRRRVQHLAHFARQGSRGERFVKERCAWVQDADGWYYPGKRNTATVESIVDALENGIEPRSSGDNGRKVLEMAIALRESHRRNHTPVRLPLADRSLKIIPHASRWLYKKEVHGKEWYQQQIANLKRE